MDRLFRRLTTARIGALERLAHIGRNAMGAMAFEPVASTGKQPDVDIPLEQLVAEVQDVLHGEGGEFWTLWRQMVSGDWRPHTT